MIEYQKSHNNSTDVSSYGKDRHLGKWVCGLRYEWRRRNAQVDTKLNGTVNDHRHQQRILDVISNSKTESTLLTRERMEKLNAIGFEWVTRLRKYSWDDRYKHLLEYKEIHGTVKVPYRYDTEDHPKLGAWVTRQRILIKRYVNGTLSKSSVQMNQHRLQLLHSVGLKAFKGMANHQEQRPHTESSFFTTKKNDKIKAMRMEWGYGGYTWDQRYQQLLEYKEIHGHVKVPKKYDTEDHPNLGKWIANQRARFKMYLSGTLINPSIQMFDHRLQLLRSIGFTV